MHNWIRTYCFVTFWRNTRAEGNSSALARHNRAAEARRENIIKLDLTENEILTCNANIIRNGPTTFHQQDGTMMYVAMPRSCLCCLLRPWWICFYLWCKCCVWWCACWTCFFVLFFFALLPAPCCFAFGLKFGPLFFYSFSLCLAHFLYFVNHTSHKFTCSSLCTICVYVAVLFSSKILRFIQYTSSPQHIQFSFVFHLQQQTKK